MKRLLCAALIAATVFSLCGCEEESIETNQTAEITTTAETSNTENNATETTTTQTESETQTETEPPPEDQTVTLTFGGDVTLSDFFNDHIKLYGIEYPFSDVKPYLDKADISFFNLETSVGVGGETRKNEGFGFISPPENIDALTYAGIDLVNCANNHIIDYGFDVFEQTMNLLDDAEIKRTGIGRNLSEAHSVSIIEKNGIKVGFMGFSSIVPFADWKAGENKSGVTELNFNSRDNLDFILSCIEENKKQCDILVISVHWGWEYEYYPDSSQRSFAREMIDSGADMIVGHHSHTLQGIEFYNNCPIFYSIGNFLFFKRDDEIGQTALFNVEFNKDGFIKGDFVPMFMTLCKTSPIYGETHDTIVNNIVERSTGMNTAFTDTYSFSPINRES